jgi:entry exclusion lipoprotein TrbK
MSVIPALIHCVTLAILVAALLSGCAREHWVYEKPNLNAARLDHDLATCRKESMEHGRLAIFQSGRVDQDAVNRCMQRRGYTPRREA